jgi:PAS domain S-box-containing protein
MDSTFRPFGIDGLGDKSWGTHLCLFYETEQDLLESLTHYFKIGLANNEFCLMITSASFSEKSRSALRQAIPSADQHLEAGDIEILSFQHWYLKDGAFIESKVINGWNAKLAQVLEKGYAGMRVMTDQAWLDQENWKAFSEYERELDDLLGNKSMIILCAYPTIARNVADVLDVVRTHNFAVAKRDGKWEILETSGFKHVKAEAERVDAELEEWVIEKNSVPSKRYEPSAILRYGLPVFTVIISLISTFLLQPYVFRTPLFFLSILISTWVGGIGPGLLAVLLSTLAINLLISPAGILETSFQNIPNVISFLITALLVSSWSEARRRAERALGKARDELENKVRERTANLNRINQALQAEIVERKQAEKALRESEIKLKEAQQLAHIGYWEGDLIADQITWSEGVYRIFRREPAEGVINLAKLEEMIHPDDRPIHQQALSEALQGSQLYDVEYRIVRPDGEVRFVYVRDEIEYNEAGRPIRMFGAVQDITERKQIEEATRLQAERAQLLADISQATSEVGLDYQRVLETITQRTAELIGDACMILQLLEDRQHLRPAAFYHSNPQALSLMQELLLNARTGSLDTPISESLLAGDPVWIPEVTPEEVRPSIPPEFRRFVDRFGFSSLLVVPLRVRGQVIGILSLSRNESGEPYTLGDKILVQDIADRAALTIQNAQLFEQVQGARERLASLSHRLLEVQEAERQTLTSELHDRVGQNLTGLSINLQNIKALLSDEMERNLVTNFDDAQALVEDTTLQIRDIMAELHLPELEEYGLAAALEIYVERAASRGNLELIADLPDLAPPRLPANIRIAVFRAAQEAITNVLKHANATRLGVSLEERDGLIRLRVEDDGKGFEPDLTFQKEVQTWGLKIMRERIESIGGEVQLESRPGEGTRVTFEIARPS